MDEPVVLVPVSPLDRAKTRLAEALDPSAREQLAAATLRTVLRACADGGLRALVVTADPGVAAITGEFDATVLDEEPGVRGLNAQLETAIGKVHAPEGGLLILHADLPLANGEALRGFIAGAAPAPSAALLRSPDGGTNAMLLRPPGRFALAYGVGSFEKHRAAAEAAGMEVRVADDERLALDLDTPEDLERFLARDDAAGTLAGRVLAAHGHTEQRR